MAVFMSNVKSSMKVIEVLIQRFSDFNRTFKENFGMFKWRKDDSLRIG